MAKGLPRSMAHAPAGYEPSPRRVKYLIKNLTVPVAATGDADALGSGVMLGDFPEGNILVLGGISYLQFTTADTDLTTTWTGKYSIGSVTMAADSGLTSTEADLIGSSTISAATSRTSPVTRGFNATPTLLNNTDGSLELNLNVVVDNAGIASGGAADLTANGYVELVYIVLGDN